MESKETDAEDVALAPVLLGLFDSLPQQGDVLRGQAGLSCLFRFLLVGKGSSDLVVGRDAEEAALNEEVLPLSVEEDCLGPDRPVRDIVVIEEVQCSNEVIDHADYLYLLEEVVRHLPLLRGQPVNLLVVEQPHPLCLLAPLSSDPLPHPLQGGPSRTDRTPQVLLGPNILQLNHQGLIAPFPLRGSLL